MDTALIVVAAYCLLAYIFTPLVTVPTSRARCDREKSFFEFFNAVSLIIWPIVLVLRTIQRSRNKHKKSP